MRIAVIGSGISGLASAWLLSRAHAVTLFETQDYLGGHTHTHRVRMQGRWYAVDSGFIVYNPLHYPLLAHLFRELGVESQPTSMSFALRNDISGLQYNATSLNRLFCQRRNLASPRFWRMLRDLLRFYREAPAVLSGGDPDLTLADYLRLHGYGSAFADDHLIPMASALWSCAHRDVRAFPVRHLVQFMVNHQMLQAAVRPTWRVVKGGSASYVAALRERWQVQVRLRTPVRAVLRTNSEVQIHSSDGPERFDHVVISCHSDQALRLLSDASVQENDILGRIRYQRNDAVLHTDPAVMPSRHSAWAAWNVLIPRTPVPACSVSYYMNLLQGLDAPEPLIVSLNATEHIQPQKILARMQYEHPVFTSGAVAAQKRKAEIQGKRRTWFAGAYWGWGFHEDGMRSAVAVARGFGVNWPLAATASAAKDNTSEVRAA